MPENDFKIKKRMTLLTAVLMLMMSGCSVARQPDTNPGSIDGRNHTEYEINDFRVNGAGGSTNGTVCCVMMPRQWTPNLTAHVSWNSRSPEAVKALRPIPQFSDEANYEKWRIKLT